MNEVHVVCPHGSVWKFVASSAGPWIIDTTKAKQVTYPDGAVRWHLEMHCDQCRLTVEVVNPAVYEPILDMLTRVDSPVVRTEDPFVVKVPLKLMADMLAWFGRQPE